MYKEDKQIITEDDFVNAEKFCPYYRCETDCYEAVRCQWFVDTLRQLQAKEQELKELRQYHNKCCEENAKKLEEWLEKYNQVSRDFCNGKYCNKENCSLLQAKDQEYNRLKRDYFKQSEWLQEQKNELDQLKAENEQLKEIMMQRIYEKEMKNAY